MRGPLPVYVEDPVARLRVVAPGDGRPEGVQAGGRRRGAHRRCRPSRRRRSSPRPRGCNFSTRLFNLLVTNVPGPQFPLYVLGRELQDLFPVAFLPENHALAVAIMSYNGGIDFGLLGDYDAMPDLDEFAQFLDDARQELVDAAQATASNGKRASSRERTSRPRTSCPGSTGA